MNILNPTLLPPAKQKAISFHEDTNVNFTVDAYPLKSFSLEASGDTDTHYSKPIKSTAPVHGLPTNVPSV